jgi:hypothetical protein
MAHLPVQYEHIHLYTYKTLSQIDMVGIVERVGMQYSRLSHYIRCKNQKRNLLTIYVYPIYTVEAQCDIYAIKL